MLGVDCGHNAWQGPAIAASGSEHKVEAHILLPDGNAAVPEPLDAVLRDLLPHGIVGVEGLLKHARKPVQVSDAEAVFGQRRIPEQALDHIRGSPHPGFLFQGKRHCQCAWRSSLAAGQREAVATENSGRAPGMLMSHD